MDAIRFGQWISEHRRAHGWQSQQAFADFIAKEPGLKTQGISEAFLARLEAGYLLHPFRGSTRRRVLALAHLLCKTPREVQHYLRIAEIQDLTEEENRTILHLKEQLAGPYTPRLMMLPPRPLRLVGRSEELHALLQALREGGPGIYALTGMPGIGKSALATEAIYQLVTQSQNVRGLFPDGIITLSGKGYQEMSGLLALLRTIADLLNPATNANLATSGNAPGISHSPQDTRATYSAGQPSEIGAALDKGRAVLAGKRLLILLDDLSVNFPLRQAREALLVQGYSAASTSAAANQELPPGPTILMTSRALPPEGIVTYHHHLEPLQADAGVELLTRLLDRPLRETELAPARQIVADVGGLPQALEFAASAIKSGTSCVLLAERLAVFPLDPLLDSNGELMAQLEEVIQTLPAETREQFLALPTLGSGSFHLDQVVNMYMTLKNGPGAALASTANDQAPHSTYITPLDALLQDKEIPSLDHAVSTTAVHLKKLVQTSLIEAIPAHPLISKSENPHERDRYALHPLLRAYGNHYQRQQCAEVIAYTDLHQQNMPQLKQHCNEVLTTITHLWYSAHYAQVIHLVGNLLQFIAHLNYADGKRLLLWGIKASEQLGDYQYLARFLTRLGQIYFYHGEFAEAQRAWERSLEIGSSSKPWLNLSLLAEERGNSEAAYHFVQTYLHQSLELGDLHLIICALSNRGFYEYNHNYLDRAEQSLRSALSLCSHPGHCGSPLQQRLTQQEIELFLTRIRGDYDRSRRIVEEMLPATQEWPDPYSVPSMFLEQAMFARKQGILDQAELFALRALQEATEMDIPALRTRSLTLLRELSKKAIPAMAVPL